MLGTRARTGRPAEDAALGTRDSSAGRSRRAPPPAWLPSKAPPEVTGTPRLSAAPALRQQSRGRRGGTAGAPAAPPSGLSLLFICGRKWERHVQNELRK